MRKKNRRPTCRKMVLTLPDLDHAKSAVLNSLSSPHSRRNYKFAMEQFIDWYCSGPRLATERYFGCKQNLEEPVNDRFGCLFTRNPRVYGKPCYR